MAELSGQCAGAIIAEIFWTRGSDVVFTSGVFEINLLDQEIAQVNLFGSIKNIKVYNKDFQALNCCPAGYHFDPAQGACVPGDAPTPPPPAPTPPPNCPPGSHWDDTLGACIPDIGPGPPIPLPPECGGDGCDWSQQIGLYLTVIVDILVKIQEAPEPPVNIEKCCLEITSALAAITSVLTTIANELGKPAPPEGPPPDFTGIQAALTSIATAVDALVAKAPVDFGPIVQAIDNLATRLQGADPNLKRIADALEVMAVAADPEGDAFVRELVARGALDATLGSLIIGQS